MTHPRGIARDESGAVAIIVALCMVGLLVIAGMTLDFGIARLDRQVNKSAADDAVAAGIHGFDTGDGQVHSFRGVCQALAFLKANEPALSSLAWAPCSDAAKLRQVCAPSDASTWAHYTGATGRYSVEIANPYSLPDNRFSEDALPASAGDNGSPCDQLAVIITEGRQPGFGSLATSSDIRTVVRSVGRVDVAPGDQAPALLLLDRVHCQVLALSAGGGGANSHVRVYGAQAYQQKRLDGTPGQVYQPGSIHADSNASQCTGGNPNPPVMLGKASDGIVAYGAPDGSASGIISSVAALNGASAATISDGTSNVYGTTAKDEVSTGIKSGPVGRDLVGRRLIDNRYLQGVTNAVNTAQNTVFGSLTPANAVANGYKKISSCNPTASDLSGVSSADAVFIDCTGNPGYKGTVPIPGKIVVFNGMISSSANVSLPNAEKVYVFGNSGNGIDASTGFSMHTQGLTDATGQCSTANTPNKAVLFVKDGGIKATGGLLRLCNTTVFLMGGQSNACLPTVGYAVTPAPNVKPCGGDYGSGQITISGTAVQDWTAPNQYDDMTMMTDAQKSSHWNDVNGPEDLALWSESGGTSSSPNYQMSGGGNMHLVGVFMTPNAAPFIVKGGSAQNLSNAQFIATSFALTGGATLNMRVDPNNTISLPTLNPFTLVR